MRRAGTDAITRAADSQLNREHEAPRQRSRRHEPNRHALYRHHRDGNADHEKDHAEPLEQTTSGTVGGAAEEAAIRGLGREGDNNFSGSGPHTQAVRRTAIIASAR